MKNKNRMKQAVSLVMLLALLVSVLPLTGMAAKEPTTPEAVRAAEHATLEAAEADDGCATSTTLDLPEGITGPDKDGLYTDPDGHQFYLFSNGTRGRVQIYKDSYAGIYFNSTVSGHGKHGNYPWMATEYLQQDSNGVLYSPGQWVYCIDFDGSAWGGETDTYEDLAQSPLWQNLSSNQKLGIILALSYGAQNGSHNNYYANVATQTIIWEYQMGGRSTASTYSSNSASPISYASDGNDNYTYCKTQIDTEYTRILSEIKNAEYTPNFTESSYTLPDIGAANAHDFVDSEGALSRGVWKVYSAPAELNASIVDGKLRVYANSYFSGTKTITLKRDLYRPTSSAYVCVAGSQWAVCGVPDDSSITITVSVEEKRTVSLKKNAQISASVLECIQGNPLYSLAGAIYEIHQGSVNGPVVATLTTNANGEATTTQTFSVGTVLYATEITAPPGYLLNNTAVSLTVKADSSQNVFNVSDQPTFDPQQILLTKTGTSSQRIAGAIFKADFFAATRPTGTPQRTWYFKSDANGRIQFDDAHLASGYSSSALYKPDGQLSFPLGCIRVTEIKPAPGYILPTNDSRVAYIYITYDSASTDATAYWGDSNGNPTTSLGMYVMENDAVTATNEEAGTATMRKTLPEGTIGSKEGYCFRLYRAEDGGKTWYGRSDADGNIYKTNSNFTEPSVREYTFADLSDGTYSLRELLSLREDLDTVTTRIRITTSGGSTDPVDYVFEGSDLSFDSNGDCTVGNIAITGLNDGGQMTIEITNAPTKAPVEIVKTSTDGAVSNIRFKVERLIDNTWTLIGYYTTNQDGSINLEPQPIDTLLRITEIVPEDYVCLSENPQIITVAATGNTVLFENKPIAELEIVKTSPDDNVAGITFIVEKQVQSAWEPLDDNTYITNEEGKILIPDLEVGMQLRITEVVPEDYVCLSENPQIVTLTLGTNTVTFENKPVTELEIVKTSVDGNVSGITFVIEKQVQSGIFFVWEPLDDNTYITNEEGEIRIPDLEVGMQLRITEVVPEDYVCLSENPQIVTLTLGTNTVTFENEPRAKLEIIKTSEDGVVDGIQFILSINDGRDYVEVGTYTTHDGGIITKDDLVLGATYRVTEIVPAGYSNSKPTQEFVAQAGTNTVSFRNRLIRGGLRIIKLDEATQTPLQGAGFRLFDDQGKEIAFGYTDEFGELFFPDLPYGDYSYQEFEAPAGFILDETLYPFTVADGSVEIIHERVNRAKEGSITIKKVDEQGKPLAGVTFLLEFSINNGRTWAPVFYRDPESPVTPGGCTSEGLIDGRLTTGRVSGSTGKDAIAIYSGLCIDTQVGVVRYRVTEVETINGYSLLSDYAFDGSLSEDDTINVTFTVVNHPTYELPKTGSTGFRTGGIALALCAVAAIFILFNLPRKKEEK